MIEESTTAPQPASDSSQLEVRTYFVRGRNALVARAAFEPLYVDYYLYQGQIGLQHAPSHDGLFKEMLAALTLYSASRPWNETIAWTIHLEEPRINLFATSDNGLGTVVGQVFTEQVKEMGKNLFFSDVSRGGRPPRRSSVDFAGTHLFHAAEQFHVRSEQRLARYFSYSEEDYVFISAQPDCDLAWLEGLTDEAIRRLDVTEQLSLLEIRHYRWHCGCTQQRMMAALAPVMKMDPEGLFAGEPSLRMRCPRCGMRHLITRESLEAWIAQAG